ncbi:piggyBac transposable element-derived protein 3-like [Melitaea cinxia]|uniref:piggyBac transposable element-derived protein 3-like n=1 Tax=Melitaea cinxia TaxID=113334 RepID=UPI001E273F59|nr:piggyBac transposable element-derived protein 3-like [Melitaea cinxia]
MSDCVYFYTKHIVSQSEEMALMAPSGSPMNRGAFAQVVSHEHNIAVVKWFDNKFVLAASTYVEAHPVQNVMRYKKEEKKNDLVTCPNLIKHYNGNMGGVDLADMLVALYRTELKGHRWYLVLFSQILDICINNFWLLYRHENSDK